MAKSISPPFSVSIAPLPSSSTNADADWMARKSALGVVRWHKFNTGTVGVDVDGSEIDKYPLSGYGSLPIDLNADYSGVDIGGVYCPQLDTQVKCSGTASMRVDIPAGTADAQPYFKLLFGPNGSIEFGAGDIFYVQWRQRFSQAYIDTDIQAVTPPQYGCKQATVTSTRPTGMHGENAMQLVVLTWREYKFLEMMNDQQGGSSWGLYEASAQYNEIYQNAHSPLCSYRSIVDGAYAPPRCPPGCVPLVANEWMTFKLMVDLRASFLGYNGVAGAFDPYGRQQWQNSKVKLSSARENQPSSLLIDWNPSTPGYFPIDAGDGSLTPPYTSGSQKFGLLWLNPHITHKDPAQQHPLMSLWYDQLIISTQDIADPS